MISTSLKFQQNNGFRAEDLKLLLTSNKIQQFKLDLRTFLHFDFENPKPLCLECTEIQQELCQVLQFLTSASNHFETLELLGPAFCHETPHLSEALNGLLKNSPNLKHLHSKVKFDLKALRNCKRLQSIKLYFDPRQPWYDFLEEDQGSLKNLDYLEIFVICKREYDILPSVESKYVEILLRHCPSLTSLGHAETSKALAKLHRADFSPQVKLRICSWGEFKYRSNFNPDDIRDAVAYNPFVEELVFIVNSIQSICYLSQLKCLFLLELWVFVEGDFIEEVGNVLKEIGSQFKYLLLWFLHTTDVTSLLKNCPNLETLGIVGRFNEFSESAIRLPKLKFLSFTGFDEAEGRFFSLLSDCQCLETVFFKSLEEENFGKFLKKKSLSNLKNAYFVEWRMSKHVFKEILINASNLEKIHIDTFRNKEMENELKNVLLEINHKASLNRSWPEDLEPFFTSNPCGFFRR